MNLPISRRAALRLGVLAGTAPAFSAILSTGLGARPGLAQQTIGYPVFGGGDAVPPEPVEYAVDGMMQSMFEAESGGTDFWMDRLLAREGADPAGDWLMSRGRALLMRVHDPDVIGFGGQLAYYDPNFDRFSNRDGFSIRLGDRTFSEDASQRRQCPSHWTSVHTGGGDLAVTVQKFITHNNVAVANVTVTNSGAATTIPVTVESDFAWQSDGAELTGVLDMQNSRGQRLTTVFPRLSGTGLTPEGGALTGEVAIGAGEAVTIKVQLGMITDEIPASASEYADVREAAPETAFADHVRAYNRWWADNLPYFDLPDEALKKFVYYRWWLMRFNHLDADIPGNDFQFPTSIEGVTGYNNAIALTVPMFIDDLKYLRDPAYAFGPWVSTGESSAGGRFVDNPGDPENWSNSYTQYIAEAAWRSYQVHGGQSPIAANLARYAEGDVKGQLATFDTDGNRLIEYDWGAMTGNDADAVSFHWRSGNLDRAESAYQYSGALAAAAAYELIGDGAKATEMRGIAEDIAAAITGVLWNPDRRLFEHVHTATGDHVPWKEINNYYPFSVGAVPNEAPYTEALRLFSDPAEYPLFPFYTANQVDKQEAAEQGNPGSNNFSQINSTVQFRLFSSVLRRYDTDAIGPEDYKKLLYWNAWAHFIDGDTAWPDANEFWADWNPGTGRIGYRSWIHHTILGSSIWTIVEDAMGLRPRSDRKIELWPIDIGWDHFSVAGLRYRDADLTITWVEPGTENPYPEVPEGYSVFIDGELAFTLDTLAPAVFDPRNGKVELTGSTGEVLYSHPTPKPTAPEQVEHAGRVVDIFAKAGVDLLSDAENLALGASVAASHTAEGSSADAAVNGATVNEPFWSAAGSGNAGDWYEIDLGRDEWIDEVRLYFYRDRLDGGHLEPASYRVQYDDGGDWTDVPGPTKTPAIPRANYNRVQFAKVRTDRLRVLMRHQSGSTTGLKEFQAFRTKDTLSREQRRPLRRGPTRPVVPQPAASAADRDGQGRRAPARRRTDQHMARGRRPRLGGVRERHRGHHRRHLHRARRVHPRTDRHGRRTRIGLHGRPHRRRTRRPRQHRPLCRADRLLHLVVGERHRHQRRHRAAHLQRRRQPTLGHLARGGRAVGPTHLGRPGARRRGRHVLLRRRRRCPRPRLLADAVPRRRRLDRRERERGLRDRSRPVQQRRLHRGHHHRASRRPPKRRRVRRRPRMEGLRRSPRDRPPRPPADLGWDRPRTARDRHRRLRGRYPGGTRRRLGGDRRGRRLRTGHHHRSERPGHRTRARRERHRPRPTHRRGRDHRHRDRGGHHRRRDRPATARHRHRRLQRRLEGQRHHRGHLGRHRPRRIRRTRRIQRHRLGRGNLLEAEAVTVIESD
ncbi:hypothetical protein GCM10029992_52490 [Glycomyces albus]